MKRWPLFVGKYCPRLTFRVDAAACLLGAMALLLLPLNWLLAAAFAAAFHECFHLLALKICGCGCTGFSVGSSGAAIETESLSQGREVLCSLAGPVGSMTLLLLARWMPRIALCAAVQGIFNLLPIFPLDGGRITRGVLQIIMKNGKWERAASVTEWTCIVLLAIIGIYSTAVLRLGWLPVMIVGFLTARVFSRKIPCKEARLAVQ